MRYYLLLLLIAFFIISGCQVTDSKPQMLGTEEIEPDASSTPTPQLDQTPGTGQADESNTFEESDNMTELENHPHVLKARDDLANQTNIPFDQIEVALVRSMTWPDSSMGCPQPGMAYTQVLQDGLLIQLKAGDFNYNYHSGGNREPFLCVQDKSSKNPPVKLDPSMGLTPFIPDLDK